MEGDFSGSRDFPSPLKPVCAPDHHANFPGQFLETTTSGTSRSPSFWNGLNICRS